MSDALPVKPDAVAPERSEPAPTKVVMRLRGEDRARAGEALTLMYEAMHGPLPRPMSALELCCHVIDDHGVTARAVLTLPYEAVRSLHRELPHRTGDHP